MSVNEVSKNTLCEGHFIPSILSSVHLSVSLLFCDLVAAIKQFFFNFYKIRRRSSLQKLNSK
jgi:hypothetical protein